MLSFTCLQNSLMFGFMDSNQIVTFTFAFTLLGHRKNIYILFIINLFTFSDSHSVRAGYHSAMVVELLSHVYSCDPMDCSLPGSSVYRISQARILEWDCHFLLQGSSQTRNQTHFSLIAGRFFTD